MNVFPNDPDEFEVVSEAGGLQSIRVKSTGEIMVTTISRLHPDDSIEIEWVKLMVVVNSYSSIPSQILLIQKICEKELHLSSVELFNLAKRNRRIEIGRISRWRAKELLADLERSGVSGEIVPYPDEGNPSV